MGALQALDTSAKPLHLNATGSCPFSRSRQHITGSTRVHDVRLLQLDRPSAASLLSGYRTWRTR
jgi:hypothetical protein